MTRRAPLALLLAVACAACGPVEPPATAVVVQPTQTVVLPVAPAAVDPLQAFAGRYAISGSGALDGCAGQIYLAARTLVVDPSRRLVFADVVNREYGARVEQDGRVYAEGRFAEGSCPDSTIYERWILAQDQQGNLEGTLESFWLLPPCTTPCLVVFNINAERR